MLDVDISFFAIFFFINLSIHFILLTSSPCEHKSELRALQRAKIQSNEKVFKNWSSYFVHKTKARINFELFLALTFLCCDWNHCQISIFFLFSEAIYELCNQFWGPKRGLILCFIVTMFWSPPSLMSQFIPVKSCTLSEDLKSLWLTVSFIPLPSKRWKKMKLKFPANKEFN